jgi:hypothetical protein
MLWLGGALSVRDTVVHSIAAQTDIPNTVLAQFDWNDDEFKFGQDILGSSFNPFAVFVFNNGFGMVKNDRLYVYDNVANAVIQQTGDVKPKDISEGKAYIQELYWDFNSR